MSRSLEHGTTWPHYNIIISHFSIFNTKHPTLATTCRFSMVPLYQCLYCVWCQLWPVRGSAGDCDSLLAAAGVAQGGALGSHTSTVGTLVSSSHISTLYLLSIYPVSTEYLLMFRIQRMQGCDCNPSPAVRSSSRRRKSPLRPAVETVDCTASLEHPPALEIENNCQENILNG